MGSASIITSVCKALSSPLGWLGNFNPIQIISHLPELWIVVPSLLDKLFYRGMYEILDYESTLDLTDPQGRTAVLTRREEIRFLQDNVVAIHDHAWGDGHLFVRYQCQPGVPVDIYEDGSRHNVLISLRETKNKGDRLELWIERTIERGFTQRSEWFETEIDHYMRGLSVSIIFPRKRPCKRATLSRRSTGKTVRLPEDNFALLPDGRQKLTWKTAHPKLHDLYTIKWIW